MSSRPPVACVLCSHKSLAKALERSGLLVYFTVGSKPLRYYAPAIYAHCPEALLECDLNEPSFQRALGWFERLQQLTDAPQLPREPFPEDSTFAATLSEGQMLAVAFVEPVLTDIRLVEIERIWTALGIAQRGYFYRIARYFTVWQRSPSYGAWHEWTEFILGPVQDAWRTCLEREGSGDSEPDRARTKRAARRMAECVYDDLAKKMALLPFVPRCTAASLNGLLPIGSHTDAVAGVRFWVPDPRFGSGHPGFPVAPWVSTLMPFWHPETSARIFTCEGTDRTFEEAVAARYAVNRELVRAVPLMWDTFRRWTSCAVVIGKGAVLVLPQCRDQEAKAEVIRLLATELWEPFQEWVQAGAKITPNPEMIQEGAALPNGAQTKEVTWSDDPAYLPLTEAIKLTDGRVSLSKLSKLLKPVGEIRHMRKPGRGCKVHIADFYRFMKGRQSDPKWAKAYLGFLAATGKGDLRFFWFCKQCGHEHPETPAALSVCPKCGSDCDIGRKPPPEPRQ